MKKKLLGIVAMVGLSLLTACGEQSVSNMEQSAGGLSEGNMQQGVGAQSAGKTVNFKEAEGDWIFVAELNHNPETDPDRNYYLPDDMYFERKISIYEEDGKTKIDFIDNVEQSSMEIYGRKLQKEDEDGFKNFFSKETEYNRYTYDVKLDDPETLVVRQTYYYDEEDQRFEYFYYYKRSDCDYEAELDKYRYVETITVSNVKELYNAIGDHKRIILKEGVYDFSTLTPEDKNNPNVNCNTEYYTYPNEWGTMAQAWCMDVNYLSLEGEEGAEVEICTEDGFLAPLAFYECSHITLKNLKVGHLVEPGYCAGSVIYLEYSYNIDIENCRLYGSGTYGIEAMCSGNINVNDTDIYECSYGLLFFSSTSNVKFNNCILRDSEYLSMFLFYEGAWDVYFTDCTITGNHSDAENTFINAENAWGDIHFENCKITNNTYSNLYKGDVVFSNCVIE